MSVLKTAFGKPPETAFQYAFAIVREFEQGPDGGYAEMPYLCPAGHPTIGWGHKITPEEGRKFEHGITESEAVTLVLMDLSVAFDALSRLVQTDLSEGQQGAIASFIFNVGEGNFARSTLLQEINANNLMRAPAELRRWVWAGGKILPGLKRRREWEILSGAPWWGGRSPKAIPTPVSVGPLLDVNSGFAVEEPQAV